MKRLLWLCLFLLVGTACSKEDNCDPQNGALDEAWLLSEAEKEMDYIFETSSEFDVDDVEALLTASEWHLVSFVAYDSAWEAITQVLRLSYRWAKEGVGQRVYTYNQDGTFACETKSLDGTPLVETGSWSFDAANRQLNLTYVKDAGTTYEKSFRLQILDEVSLVWDYVEGTNNYRELYSRIQ